MDRLKKVLLKLFLIPYIILIVHIICNYQQIKLDGLDAELWCFVSEEDTKYSDHFSNKKFSTIPFSMAESDVCKLLGEPLRRWQVKITPTGNRGDFWVLSFSVPVDGKSYRERFVYIENHLVVETFSGMYYD